MPFNMNKLDTSKKPAQQDWHRADIKAALEKHGLSLSRLARLHGFARTSTAQALHFQWPKMERLIADALGIHPREIWPSRYDEDGQPNGPTCRNRNSDSTETISQRNVHVRGAA